MTPAVEYSNIPVEKFYRLSPREQQVARGIAAGQSLKEIALQAGISRRTAEAHKANLYLKLADLPTLQAIVRLVRDVDRQTQIA